MSIISSEPAGPMTVIYCATGPAKYWREARQSAVSLRRTNPAVRIVLFTDVMPAETSPFDVVHLIEAPQRSFADKINVLRDAPYDRFFFLDGDTYVIGDISPLFVLLERFDFVAAHDLLRIHTPMPHLPTSFPEFNTGVLGIRRSPAVQNLLGGWLAIFLQHRSSMEHLPTQDQPSFRQLVWDSNARVATLTPEWNCMFDGGSGVSGRVMILHGRSPQLDYVARKINAARIHPQTHDLRNRWFKGEGSGLGWIRRNTRMAITFLKYKLAGFGLFRKASPDD